MTLAQGIRKWLKGGDNRGQRKPFRKAHSVQLGVEHLEDRVVPSSNTIAWNGGNWYLNGMDYSESLSGYDDFGSGKSQAYIQSDFATMASEGVHAVKWYIFH